MGTGESDSAELNFEFAAVVGNRNFEMKVTQIICNSNARPPEGCLQWHTGTEGRIETFNFAGNNQHLNDQQYNICIRQEMGKLYALLILCKKNCIMFQKVVSTMTLFRILLH